MSAFTELEAHLFGYQAGLYDCGRVQGDPPHRVEPDDSPEFEAFMNGYWCAQMDNKGATD